MPFVVRLKDILRMFIVMYSWHDWYGYARPETRKENDGKQDAGNDDN